MDLHYGRQMDADPLAKLQLVPDEEKFTWQLRALDILHDF